MKKSFTVLLLVVVSLTKVIAQTSPNSERDFLVKPYLQYATKTSMKILWETHMPTTSEVYYGKAVARTDKPILTSNVTLKGKRRMHEVALEGLSEATNYFWKVVSKDSLGNILESEIYTFKTVVNDSTAFMFALVGDPQRNKRTPWAWDSIATAVYKERPSFVVNAGDLVDWGFNKNEWVDDFLAPGHDLMSRIPMYTVLGNHDADSDYYYQYMANPAPEYFYTFTFGNAEFFMIDSNRDISEGSDQYNWLEQKLAQSQAEWKIAVHHHPPYSSETDDHGNTLRGELSKMGHDKVRDLPKLYDKYGVDFSLFGHTHVYERSWPIRDNRINQRKGTIYINSGGAGGGLESFAPTRNWFTVEVNEGHHYCTFVVYDKTLIFKAIDHRGRVMDAFQLDKDKDRDEVVVVQPPAPIIYSDAYTFKDQTRIVMEPGLEGLKLVYTLDGSEPTRDSKVYSGSITLKESSIFKTKAYNQAGKSSRTVSKEFVKTEPLSAIRVKSPQRGWRYTLYEGNWGADKKAYFSSAKKLKEGILSILKLDDVQVGDEYWGIDVSGYLKVPETGTYTFYGYGSRGLYISIDGQLIIEREHEQQEVVQMVLEKGFHKVSIRSLQRNWRKALGFGYWNEGTGRTPFTPFELWH
jgi:predicted phosphodiesterase